VLIGWGYATNTLLLTRIGNEYQSMSQCWFNMLKSKMGLDISAYKIFVPRACGVAKWNLGTEAEPS